METSVSIILILTTITGVVGIVLNALLTHLAIFRTPQSMRRYSILIVNFGLTDLLACVVSIFVHPTKIPFDTNVAYIILGPCRWFGDSMCFKIFCISYAAYSHALWSLTVSFGFRYYVLLKPPPKPFTIFIVLLIVSVPSIVEGMTFSYAVGPSTEIKRLFHAALPEFNITGLVMSGVLDITHNYYAAIPTIVYCVPVVPLYVAIVVLRNRTKTLLECTSFSQRTRAMHNGLLTALVFQTFIPVFYLAGMSAYFIGQLDVYHARLLDCQTLFLIGLVPVCNPVSSLFFIKPYRIATLNMILCRSRKTVNPTIHFDTSVKEHSIGRISRISANQYRVD